MFKNGLRKVGLFFFIVFVLIFGSQYLSSLGHTAPSTTVSTVK